MAVEALQSGAQGFANAVERLAIQNRAFAEELVFKHNIRGKITPNALKQITKDMFDKKGKMTEQGRKEIQELIQEHGLSKNATWDEILQAVRARKDAISKKLKFPTEIKMPKIIDVKEMLAKAKEEIPKIKLSKFDFSKLAKYLKNIK